MVGPEGEKRLNFEVARLIEIALSEMFQRVTTASLFYKSQGKFLNVSHSSNCCELYQITSIGDIQKNLKVFLIPKNNGPEEKSLILYEDSHESQFCRVCM